jgi:methyl-accepting chemotaxis protein
MVQVGEAAQQTAQNLRETSEAIRQLNEAAQGLQTEFSRFTVS